MYKYRGGGGYTPTVRRSPGATRGTTRGKSGTSDKDT